MTKEEATPSLYSASILFPNILLKKKEEIFLSLYFMMYFSETSRWSYHDIWSRTGRARSK
jgi:hypothetical protein